MAELVKGIELLDNIPFKLDISRIMARLSLHGESTLNGFQVQELSGEIIPVARPKALYKMSRVNQKTGHTVVIDGAGFSSHLLRVNLDKAERVFPYVVTCGQELDSIKIPGSNASLSYCLKLIQEMILTAAWNYLQSHLTRKYTLDFLFALEPGEMDAWPARHRKPLFALLENVEDMTGVKLNEDYSMTPQYSRCGIFYYTEIEFESCQLCPKEPCMGRRAPYNQELAQKYPQQAKSLCGH
jgi:hypothetical protein